MQPSDDDEHRLRDTAKQRHHAHARRLGNGDQSEAEHEREDDEREHRAVGGGAKRVRGTSAMSHSRRR